MVKTEELIISDLALRGSGASPYSPMRRVTQIYRKNGSLLAEYDYYGQYTVEDMIAFAKIYLANYNKDINDLIETYERIKHHSTE